ncbi:MAG: hypothetical protein CPDRYMAC_6733 [uncultured Paraburkholderia sp.]|nr:MAG: hypothetical protein CPDRYDRY_6691 [uncultured Paraburkholderia sp.]CAH2945109.1 MAG: hypothetical protein CPDRYMAC_6733 [uncultured Paraburkholderia sp.]
MSGSASGSFVMPAHVVSMPSAFDFTTTVARIEAALAERNIALFAKIDQARAAADSGTALRLTVLLVFGNPAAGTPIMAANPHAAVELPLKAVIWEDDANGVHVDYADVTQVLAPDYGLDPVPFAALGKVAGMLRSVVSS